MLCFSILFSQIKQLCDKLKKKKTIADTHVQSLILKELEFKISQSEDDAVINRSMREKLVSVSRLENEIQKLKEENDHLRFAI